MSECSDERWEGVREGATKALCGFFVQKRVKCGRGEAWVCRYFFKTEEVKKSLKDCVPIFL